MFSAPQDLVRLIQDLAVFGLVLSLWFMAMTIWSIKQKKRSDLLKARLTFADPGNQVAEGKVLRLFHDGKEATTVVPDVEQTAGAMGRLETMWVQAGFRSAPTVLLTNLGVGLIVSAMIGYMVSSSLVIAIAVPVGVLIVFWIYLNQRISKAAAKFERQLVDSLELAARSLRVGHPLVGAFQLIADEVPAPVGELFAQVCQQQDLGVPMEASLSAVARNSSSEDMALFATAVIIQIRSGGNLADMMQRLAAVIRERQRLARRVRVLTAQTQFSKRVLLAMPFLSFVCLSLINANYMRPLYTTWIGEAISCVAAILLVFGWMLMNWLAKLDY